MRELSKEEIELINKMAQSYWIENNRTHIDNEEEWNLTRSLVEKLTIPNVVKSFYCDTKRCKEDGSGQCIECALFELNKEQ